MTIFDVRTYWEERYSTGGDSGAGSRGASAARKADFLNRFVADRRVRSVLELGCGDGTQLAFCEFPEYVGLDVSSTAIARCEERFAGDPTKWFHVYERHAFDAVASQVHCELTLSIDVVYHLVEDVDFHAHMTHLFACATRHVIIYATNVDDPEPGQSPHIRHRAFTDWVSARRPEWALTMRVPVRSERTRHDPDFFVFSRR